MKYEAIENFSGVISMNKGQVREIPNESLANDLIKAGYIKKCVGNDNKALKEELEKANNTIIMLQDENAKLIEENNTLKELLEEKDANSNITPEGEDGNPENGDVTPEGEDGNPESGDITPEDNKTKNTSKKK